MGLASRMIGRRKRWVFSGALAMVEPHQSIPNLDVKQQGGDNTCGGACRKDSLVPGDEWKGKGVASFREAISFAEANLKGNVFFFL